MLRIAFLLALVALTGSRVESADRAELLDRARVLPLALNDNYEFRKTKTYTLTPREPKDFNEPMLVFERKRALYGAVNELDREERYGQYFTFFWRIRTPSPGLEVRFEYRQAALGNFVQAQVLTYETLRTGSFRSEFRVVGDDYAQDGQVTAWRALLVENGAIVALTQSALWR